MAREGLALVCALAVLVMGGGLLLTAQHAAICARVSPELAREIDCSELADAGTKRLSDKLQALVQILAGGLMRGEP